MKVAFEMEYLNPIKEKASIHLVRYSDNFREEYKEMFNECYHKMREALDIKSYDFIQDDSFFEEGMDNVYLLLGNGEIIGSVALKGEEIDDLLVKKKYRGQGYGKELLLWAIENIDSKRPILYVAGWNEKAVELYKKTGFEITKTIQI